MTSCLLLKSLQNTGSYQKVQPKQESEVSNKHVDSAKKESGSETKKDLSAEQGIGGPY